MDAFIKHLQSPDFLLFSVFLALVLSILANYLTRFLDRLFASGTSLARGLSKRGRDKKAARAQEIANWIDSRPDGAVIALIEANFICLGGLVTMTIVFIGMGVALMVHFTDRPPLEQLPVLVLFLALGVVGLGTLIVGTNIRDVVMKHPKGLAGLHRK